MKVKITFELDLKDTSYNVDKVRLIPVCLQNLGNWFYNLHLYYLHENIRLIAASSKNIDKRWVKAVSEHHEENESLSEQLFYNYRVEGTTEDGHEFVFTHQDPGYKEKTLVDGKETHIEPCEE
jgi:hypothetical protein